MSTFKVGERVRVVRPFDDFKVGQIVTIRGFECDDDVAYVAVDGSGAVWDLNRFEKVEPEFVVGQQVSGDDYARLPVGSKVSNPNATILTKVDEDGWTRDDGSSTRPHSNGSMRSNFTGRTLTHLGDGTCAEPEDKDDLYVEPEPLKEDQRTFNDDDVQRLKVTHGSEVLFDGLAVFEEADDGKVTVTPVPRCTSLFIRPGSDSSLGIVRCGQHQGHGHGHWTIGEHPATSWNDNQEYGRITEGGAS